MQSKNLIIKEITDDFEEFELHQIEYHKTLDYTQESDLHLFNKIKGVLIKFKNMNLFFTKEQINEIKEYLDKENFI